LCVIGSGILYFQYKYRNAEPRLKHNQNWLTLERMCMCPLSHNNSTNSFILLTTVFTFHRYWNGLLLLILINFLDKLNNNAGPISINLFIFVAGSTSGGEKENRYISILYYYYLKQLSTEEWFIFLYFKVTISTFLFVYSFLIFSANKISYSYANAFNIYIWKRKCIWTTWWD
jgi:hypothetical protein